MSFAVKTQEDFNEREDDHPQNINVENWEYDEEDAKDSVSEQQRHSLSEKLREAQIRLKEDMEEKAK